MLISRHPGHEVARVAEINEINRSLGERPHTEYKDQYDGMDRPIFSDAGPLGHPEPTADEIDTGPEDGVRVIQLQDSEHGQNAGPQGAMKFLS